MIDQKTTNSAIRYKTVVKQVSPVSWWATRTMSASKNSTVHALCCPLCQHNKSGNPLFLFWKWTDWPLYRTDTYSFWVYFACTRNNCRSYYESRLEHVGRNSKTVNYHKWSSKGVAVTSTQKQTKPTSGGRDSGISSTSSAGPNKLTRGSILFYIDVVSKCIPYYSWSQSCCAVSPDKPLYNNVSRVAAGIAILHQIPAKTPDVTIVSVASVTYDCVFRLLRKHFYIHLHKSKTIWE